MGLFQAFNISATGMTAERFRTDIIAQNIANVASSKQCFTFSVSIGFSLSYTRTERR